MLGVCFSPLSTSLYASHPSLPYVEAVPPLPKLSLRAHVYMQSSLAGLDGTQDDTPFEDLDPDRLNKK